MASNITCVKGINISIKKSKDGGYDLTVYLAYLLNYYILYNLSKDGPSNPRNLVHNYILVNQ
jgi:hypothetical protein